MMRGGVVVARSAAARSAAALAASRRTAAASAAPRRGPNAPRRPARDVAIGAKRAGVVDAALPLPRRGLTTSSSTNGANPPPPPPPRSPRSSDPKHAKTSAGSGHEGEGGWGGLSVVPRGPVTWPALGLVAVVAASAVGYYTIERERRLENAMGKIVSTGKPAIGGPWSLVDLNGNLVTDRSFEGKWTLLYFGFARCPDICPSEMVKVGKVMDTLKKEHPQLAEKIQPVFVSVDPARDSLKALREYSRDFHPSYAFLTGTPEQVQQMAKKYRVYVSKADETEDGDYLVDHSIVVYFHDDTGDLADCFTQSMRPSDVVEKVVERMTFVPTY